MSTTPVTWTWEENKAFENGIALYLKKESEDEWQRIAAMVPSKTVEQVKYHYKILVEDIQDIEAGIVPLLNYVEAEQSDNESVGSSSIKK